MFAPKSVFSVLCTGCTGNLLDLEDVLRTLPHDLALFSFQKIASSLLPSRLCRSLGVITVVHFSKSSVPAASSLMRCLHADEEPFRVHCLISGCLQTQSSSVCPRSLTLGHTAFHIFSMRLTFRLFHGVASCTGCSHSGALLLSAAEWATSAVPP